jgi:hypothetical protein
MAIALDRARELDVAAAGEDEGEDEGDDGEGAEAVGVVVAPEVEGPVEEEEVEGPVDEEEAGVSMVFVFAS